jgi:alanine dehydrogenase
MRRVELIPNGVKAYVVADEEIAAENGGGAGTGEEIREGMEAGCTSPCCHLGWVVHQPG